MVLSPNNTDLALTRSFTLTAETPSFVIGRASRRGLKNRVPSKDNGWFDSRVMSRDHAELSVCMDKRVISWTGLLCFCPMDCAECVVSQNLYVCDSGSTHGTWLNNVKLITGEETPLISGDILRFGVNVDRGDGSSLYLGLHVLLSHELTSAIEEFPALAVKCKINWSDEYGHICIFSTYDHTDMLPRWPAPEETPTAPLAQPISTWESNSVSEPRPSSSTNTFCVPEGDSDVEEIAMIACLSDEDERPNESAPLVPLGPQMDSVCLIEDGQRLKESSQNDALARFNDHGPECVEVFPTEPSDDYLDSNEEEDSDLESSDPSAFSHTSDGVEFIPGPVSDPISDTYKHDALPSASECEIESESYSDAGSESNSDDESSIGDQNEFIDPSKLTQKENFAVGVFDQVPGNLAGSAINTAEQVAAETSEPRSIMPVADGWVSSSTHFIPASSLRPESLHPKAKSRPVEDQERLLSLAPSSADPATWGTYIDGPFSCDREIAANLTEEDIRTRNILERDPILRNVTKERQAMSTVASSSASLKRKASGPESQDAQLPESVVPVSQPELDTIPNSEVVDAISSALSETEPPKKRVKSSHSSSNTVAGYTATAVISALLGGLGTIALLAALPAEYFQ